MPAMKKRHRVVGLLIYALVGIASTALVIGNIQQFGHRSVVFSITDGAAIKPGTEVRVAGLHAGKVDSVHLVDDDVQVRLLVDDDIYLGDQTSIEIRMLTAAGGYYVDVISSGVNPLGDNPIPASRTRPPYRLSELLANGVDKVDSIDFTQLGESLDRLSKVMDTSPDGIATMVDAMRSVSDILSHQKGQLQTLADVGQELLRTAGANQELLNDVMRRAAVLVVTIDNVKVQLQQTLPPLLKAIKSVMGIANFYDSHRDWLLDSLQRTNNALNVVNTDLPRIIWNLGNFVNDVRNLISPKGPQPLEDHLLATDYCVPMPGRSC